MPTNQGHADPSFRDSTDYLGPGARLQKVLQLLLLPCCPWLIILRQFLDTFVFNSSFTHLLWFG